MAPTAATDTERRWAGVHRRTFSALSVRNYRLYFFGQMVSQSGSWMQTVAQALLVLHLHGSGTEIGIVIACQYVPMLLLSPYGGVVADRHDKRRILIATQSLLCLFAFVLAVLVLTDVVQMWMVCAVAGVIGCVNSFDNPARNSFVFEMVGSEHLTNAVSLNSVIANLGRITGPAVAGVLVATVGLGPCFLYNSVSFAAVIGALVMMRPAELYRRDVTGGARPSVLDGLRYVRSRTELLVPLVLLTLVGTFAWEFNVTLPLMAKYVFDAGPGSFAFMTTLMGVGAVFGALGVATTNRTNVRALVIMTLLFGLMVLLAALAPTLAIEYAVMVPMGAAGISMIALGNTTLQMGAAPHMRGRVMALWSMGWLGTTPLGGPLVGWAADATDPRVSLLLGAGVTLVSASVAGLVLARAGRRADTVLHDDIREEIRHG